MSSTPPVLILEHGTLAPPGVFGQWLAARGLEAEVVVADRDPLPTQPERYAAIASLGSLESAGAADVPWVAEQIALLRGAVAADVPVLGLCFGGQALSVAL